MLKKVTISTLLLLSAFVMAQQARVPMLMPSMGRIFNEAIVYPTENQTGLAIFFRLPYDRLVFSRNREAEGAEAFISEVKVNIELYKDGRRVTDQNWTSKKYASSFEETKDKLKDLTGVVHFKAEPGVYAWRMTLNDQPGMWRSITLPDFSKAGQIGRPFLLKGAAENNLLIQNLSGNVSFGADAFLAVFVNAETMHWKLLRIPDKAMQRIQERDDRDRNDSRAGRRPRFGGIQDNNPERMKPLPDRADMPLPTDTKEVANGEVGRWLNLGDIRPIDTGFATTAGNQKMALIPLEARLLEDGHYVVVLETLAGKAHYVFSTLWRDMPLSLFNLDLAVESMKFIVDKDELRQLKRGNTSERAERFRIWWKAKDPSPETPFNELMAEYFTRVDYAATAFQTGTRGLDGMQSDRARIYITKGPPVKTSRLLPDSGGVREIWEYPNGQTFVFEAASSLDPFVLLK
ncbi:MAG: GWxTD domain-containing protein [Bacteroidetes Order II. Incertae sedis bacterium]|nr:GWxTD domain-containing protein [Bacteroidetes Order II. bacterium]